MQDTPHADVDLLIITALPEEHAAVRAVVGVTAWQEHDASGTAPYATARHPVPGGGTLSVALARPIRMGGRSTGPLTTTLANALRPGCLAMAGVCAGNPQKTAPGDVIVAAPAYEWDEGKHAGDTFQPDHEHFPLHRRWMRAAQEFDPTGLSGYGTATGAEADNWFLERLHRGQEPRTLDARKRYFPHGTWAERLAKLNEGGLIVRRDAGWALTAAGRTHIERVMYDDVDGPARLPLAVHTGPMASVSAVMAKAGIWDTITASLRGTLALDMEAATVATVAGESAVPHWLVVKAVTDHADPAKDDRFKAFAATASAEVLLALAGHLLPGTPAAGQRPADPVPAAVRRDVLRQLAYDWPDLADLVGVPTDEARQFRPGDEPRELWDWLGNRARLADLPGACEEIGRPDLAARLRSYL